MTGIHAWYCDRGESLNWRWRHAPQPRGHSVLIADGDELLVRFVRQSLEDDHCFRVITGTTSGRYAIEAARLHQPDVVLIGTSLSDMGITTAVARIVNTSNRPRIVVLASADTATDARRTAELGAVGILHTSIPATDIPRRLHQLLDSH